MRLIALCLIASLFAIGCASSNRDATTQPTASAQHAECLVCKRNADLACVDVAVDSATPRCVYDGSTYYFCSDECRNAFMKSPQKYLSNR